ncbi:hypothetical protein ES703_62848 [subsurface metagenome]
MVLGWRAAEGKGGIIQGRCDDAGIGREGLSRAAGPQQLDKGGQVFPPGYHLLHARHGDMHRRCLSDHADIAFALHQHQGAGIGGNEIGPADADIGREKFFP